MDHIDFLEVANFLRDDLVSQIEKQKDLVLSVDWSGKLLILYIYQTISNLDWKLNIILILWESKASINDRLIGLVN